MKGLFNGVPIMGKISSNWNHIPIKIAHHLKKTSPGILSEVPLETLPKSTVLDCQHLESKTSEQEIMSM